MTLEECYIKMNGDFDAAKSQLMSEALIERFMLKFPKDGSMDQLREAVEAGDIEASFKASHTLKGVALNLALKGLHQSAHELTEQLRSLAAPADMELYKKVDESYRLVIDTIAEYAAEKQ